MTLQVFTTVFLAESLQSQNHEGVQEVDRLDQRQPAAMEFKRTLRECVSKLESRGFFAWDDPEQD
jgi:hypothetical protein